jgi:hypothetical protein
MDCDGPAREHIAVRQLWAYAYRVVPPPPAGELGDLRKLLDRENAAAFSHAQAWAAQLILEQRSTQILVVADSPAQNRAVNRRLESQLERLDAPFRVTDPIAIRNAASPPTA